MTWTMIEKPAERAKSQIHLSISIPEKRGKARFYVSLPTILSKKFGFESVNSCNVFAGSDERAAQFWIKPDTEGQRGVKWRKEVFMVQLEMIPGMSLREQSEHVDYEAGPENVGVVFTLPASFFTDKEGHVVDRKAQEKPGSLELNGVSFVLGSKEVILTKTEAMIMNLLLLRFGKVVKKKYLHDEIYQLDPNGGANEKIIDVLVCKVRAKLAAAKMAITIVTHTGVGYELRNAVS